MVMNRNRRVPRLICRHHNPEYHPVSGICFPHRGCRVLVHFTAENLPRPGIFCKPVGKPLRAIIIAFFSSILRIYRLSVIFCRSLDKITLHVKQTDSVLDKQDIFPEAPFPRRRNHCLFCKAVFFSGKITVPFRSRRFYDNRSEQPMVTVVPHISKGLYDTGSIFLVCMPEISFALANPYRLLHFIITYINTGIADRIILQELRI